MSEVQVKYGDNAAGYANQLLAAARRLEVPTSVVRFSPDGHFDVPEEVAEEAGVSYDVGDDYPEPEVQPSEPDADADGDPKADGDADADADADADGDGDGDADTDESKGTAEAEALPIGKALDEALKNAGLSKSGNKADKQARLAEHLNKE